MTGFGGLSGPKSSEQSCRRAATVEGGKASALAGDEASRFFAG